MVFYNWTHKIPSMGTLNDILEHIVHHIIRFHFNIIGFIAITLVNILGLFHRELVIKTIFLVHRMFISLIQI